MADTERELFDRLSFLLAEWVESTATLVENSASDVDLRAQSEWATDASGEVAGAFEMLSQALPTEELGTALRAVLFWGMSGLLHTCFSATLGPEWMGRFTEYLRESGHLPFAIEAAPEEID